MIYALNSWVKLRKKNQKMKKIRFIYIIIFILLYSVALQAQQVRSLWLNAVTGLNSNWILNQNAYGNPEFEYATSFGFTGGLGITYFQKRHYGLNGSILVTQMGQNYSGEQGGGDADRKVKLTYLEVPLLLMRDIPYMQYPTWISFGPDVLILINANQEYSREGGRPLPNPDGMLDGNVKARYKPVDIALSFSVNRMYTLNYSRKSMILFSVNSALGLTDINSSEWQLPNMHNKYSGSHNFYIGVKVGMMFKVARLGGKNW